MQQLKEVVCFPLCEQDPVRGWGAFEAASDLVSGIRGACGTRERSRDKTTHRIRISAHTCVSCGLGVWADWERRRLWNLEIAQPAATDEANGLVARQDTVNAEAFHYCFLPDGSGLHPPPVSEPIGSCPFPE